MQRVGVTNVMPNHGNAEKALFASSKRSDIDEKACLARPWLGPSLGPRPPAPQTTDCHRGECRSLPRSLLLLTPATRHERRTGSTPERRRFEPYRAASPREPVRRRSFHKCFRPPVAPTPGGRVRRSFSRQMASQQLRRAPVAPATRHERRTGSTPERNAIRALSSGLATIARADPRRASSAVFTTDDGATEASADRSRDHSCDPTRVPHGIYARAKGDSSNPMERPLLPVCCTQVFPPRCSLTGGLCRIFSLTFLDFLLRVIIH